MSTSAEAVASGGVALGFAAIFLQIPIAGALIRFLMIFKVLNRLRLINVNPGGILLAFLKNVYNLFEYGNAGMKDSSFKYRKGSRGKLSQYNIYITPFIDIPHIFYLYMVSLVILACFNCFVAQPCL